VVAQAGQAGAGTSGRRNTVLAVLAVAVAVAALAVVFSLTTRDRLEVSTRAFTLAPTTTLTFQVTKPAASSVSCDLRARDAASRTVGERLGVLVGPAARRTVVVTETVETTSLPTVVEVEACRLLPVKG